MNQQTSNLDARTTWQKTLAREVTNAQQRIITTVVQETACLVASIRRTRAQGVPWGKVMAAVRELMIHDQEIHQLIVPDLTARLQEQQVSDRELRSMLSIPSDGEFSPTIDEEVLKVALTVAASIQPREPEMKTASELVTVLLASRGQLEIS